MPATVPRSPLPAWRSAGGGRWLTACAAAAALALGLATAYRAKAPSPVLHAAAPMSVAAGLAQEQCLEAAGLVHDVRWAAACMRLAEQGQGDGFAECQLPDAVAANLYALLGEAERSCQAPR